MNPAPIDIAALSDEQVSSLLALGSSKNVVDDQARDPVDLLRQAINGPNNAQLQFLVSDLKRKVLDSENGPLSFQRLTDLSVEDAQDFQGETFARVLMSSSTSRSALDKLARYGALMSQQAFDDSTRLTGIVIRSLAQMALASRYDIEFAEDDFCDSKRIATDFARVSLDSGKSEGKS